MAVSFSGRPPIVAVPSQKSKKSNLVTPDAEAIKGALAARLAMTKGFMTASEMIGGASACLIEDELQIQTDLSSQMFPVVITPETLLLMKATLAEYGVSWIRINCLPRNGSHSKKVTDTPSVMSAIDTSFKRLSGNAARLNTISDLLTKQIRQIDAVLKNLNLGVTAWVSTRNEEDEDGNCYLEYIGYTKFANRWSVAIKTCSGLRGDPNGGDENIWSFADAPRQMRIRAVPSIPKLLNALCAAADSMIAQLEPEIKGLEEVTAALSASEGGQE